MPLTEGGTRGVGIGRRLRPRSGFSDLVNRGDRWRHPARAGHTGPFDLSLPDPAAAIDADHPPRPRAEHPPAVRIGRRGVGGRGTQSTSEEVSASSITQTRRARGNYHAPAAASPPPEGSRPERRESWRRCPRMLTDRVLGQMRVAARGLNPRVRLGPSSSTVRATLGPVSRCRPARVSGGSPTNSVTPRRC